MDRQQIYQASSTLNSLNKCHLQEQTERERYHLLCYNSKNKCAEICYLCSPIPSNLTCKDKQQSMKQNLPENKAVAIKAATLRKESGCMCMSTCAGVMSSMSFM
jgi:hypothetical protein